MTSNPLRCPPPASRRKQHNTTLTAGPQNSQSRPPVLPMICHPLLRPSSHLVDCVYRKPLSHLAMPSAVCLEIWCPLGTSAILFSPTDLLEDSPHKLRKTSSDEEPPLTSTAHCRLPRNHSIVRAKSVRSQAMADSSPYRWVGQPAVVPNV